MALTLEIAQIADKSCNEGKIQENEINNKAGRKLEMRYCATKTGLIGSQVSSHIRAAWLAASCKAKAMPCYSSSSWTNTQSCRPGPTKGSRGEGSEDRNASYLLLWTEGVSCMRRVWREAVLVCLDHTADKAASPPDKAGLQVVFKVVEQEAARRRPNVGFHNIKNS